MDFTNPLTGTPIQPPPDQFSGLSNQWGAIPVQQQNSGATRRSHGRRRRSQVPPTLVTNATERFVDNTITNPAFWSTVFSTLRNNENMMEDIRRDIEQQEIQAARERETLNGTRVGTTTSEDRGGSIEENGTTTSRNENDGDGESDRTTSATQPDRSDLYETISHCLQNPGRSRNIESVQRLNVLLDELQVDRLWSFSGDLTMSFGFIVHVMIKLFTASYATQEEILIIRLLRIALDRSFEVFGLGADQPEHEPFVVTYRRRSRVLRDFAAFRYMLEVCESLGRIARKQKNDLILLYLMLTTPEVRLHRNTNAGDRENTLAFRDLVTGFTIQTPVIMGRPMGMEMHLDSVFGNVYTNLRLLERSLIAALNNHHRKTAKPSAAREVEVLLENSRLLDVDIEKPRSGLRSYRFGQNEHLALRHMLEMSSVVSMMAEEFRVFIAGAPPSRSAEKTASEHVTEGLRKNKSAQRRRAYVFRRPIFFPFKPTSQAMN